MATPNAQLRLLPAVDRFVAQIQGDPRLVDLSQPHLTALVRETIDMLRQRMRNDACPDLSTAEQVAQWLLDEVCWRYHLRLQAVINASGVIIHTNLGRSLLAESAQKAVQHVANHYCNLEYDLRQGERGSRHTQITQVLKRLLTVEGAMVVNNNAAATFLALNTLAAGQEVIISRGQLVEIGGSFRMPDVMARSGAIMHEVGTTNKTHLSDYVEAINENTGAIIDVHTSNYRIQGFTQSVPLGELVALGRQHNIPVISDLGSGVLIDLSQFGLPREPMVQESLAAGADVVMFSGDKLLGGPQAGILLGQGEWIAKMLKNPFTRMFRCDKMTLAALEATLELYYDSDRAIREIPTLRQIAQTPESLKAKARQIMNYLSRQTERAFDFNTMAGFSEVGGGSLPMVKMGTTLISVDSEHLSAHYLDDALRQNTPPIIGRIQQDQFLLDPRTMQDNDEHLIAEALNRIRSHF